MPVPPRRNVQRAAGALPLAALLAAVLTAAGSPLGAQEQQYRQRWPGIPDIQDQGEAMELYRGTRDRVSFWKQFMGEAVLANSRHPQGIELLYREYKRPFGPVDEHRALLAALLTTHYKTPEYWDALLGQGQDFTRGEEHTWLQHRLMRVQCRNDEAPVHALARDPKAEPLLRAVAMEALAAEAPVHQLDPEAIVTVSLVMAELPRKEEEANLLVESALELLRAYGRFRHRGAYMEALQPFLDRLGDRRSELRHKIVLSRTLGLIFEVENLGISPEPWQPILDGKPISEVTGVRGKGSGTRAGFFGINSISQRVVYVVDASDSMLEPVRDKEELLKPMTGGKKSGPVDTRTPEEIALELALPWDRINNRFDAAIAFLELSLKRLDKSQSFAVVLFGDKAETLRTTRTMVSASQGNIQKAIAELRAIEPGPPVNEPNKQRPNGTLMGTTNLHGGLKLAFQLQDDKRPLQDALDVDFKAIEDGCDTVFVLSDGDPTYDNWPVLDQRDPWDQAGDPEAGVLFDNDSQLIFQGPMSQQQWLLIDLERLNLLRKVHLHAVGFGDVARRFLEQMAKLGDGEALKLGV